MEVNYMEWIINIWGALKDGTIRNGTIRGETRDENLLIDLKIKLLK